MFYSIHSEADVNYLIEERIKYVQSQKAEIEDLTKDPHVNINDISSQNYVNPVDYESINADIDLTQESVDTEYIEESNSNSNSDSEEEIQFLDLDECKIIEELDLWELEQTSHIMVNSMRDKYYKSLC